MPPVSAGSIWQLQPNEASIIANSDLAKLLTNNSIMPTEDLNLQDSLTNDALWTMVLQTPGILSNITRSRLFLICTQIWHRTLLPRVSQSASAFRRNRNHRLLVLSSWFSRIWSGPKGEETS